jgi:hypothetical protein
MGTRAQEAKKAEAMRPKEYLARGYLTLSGVQFTIIASSPEEARAKAARGEWRDYDVVGASTADCKIYHDSLQLNE